MPMNILQRATEDTGLWEYKPTRIASIMVTILFSTSMSFTIWRTSRFRAWVWFVFIFSIFLEFLGFIFRTQSIYNPQIDTLYALQYSLIFVAPVVTAAGIYIIFGRLLFLVTPPQSRNFKTLWCPPRWVMPIFVGFDIVSIFLQLIGAVTLATAEDTDSDFIQRINRGRIIALMGVIVQLVAFGFFTIVVIRFYSISKAFARFYEWRISRDNAPNGKATFVQTGTTIDPDWMKLLRAITIACILIFIRSVYRLEEFSARKSSFGAKIESHEWVMYVFDALPIYIVVITFAIFHPGKYLPFLKWRLPKSEKSVTTTDSEENSYQMAVTESA